MNRETKFRAWDKKEKIWIYKEGYSIQEIATNGYELDGRDLEWIEYTGLEDKNGKEIYEGDILKAKSQGTEYIGKVYYEEAQWFGAEDYLYQAIKNGAEVIGNIYENTELLK